MLYDTVLVTLIKLHFPGSRSDAGVPLLSGPETGKRKRVRRKADGKLTFLATHFSLPILAYPFQGH